MNKSLSQQQQQQDDEQQKHQQIKQVGKDNNLEQNHTIKQQKLVQQQDDIQQRDIKNTKLQKKLKQKDNIKSLQQSLQQQCQQANTNIQQANIIRAPIIKQFYGQSFNSQLQKFTLINNKSNKNKSINNTQKISNLPSGSYVSQLPNSYLNNSENSLFNKKSIQIQKLQINDKPLINLIKCLKILAQINQFLIVRLFENPYVNKINNKTVFGVWLCIDYQWRCITVDLQNILLSQKSNKPYYFEHKSNKQLWPIVLLTALSSGLKGYQNLQTIPCYKYFNILTGSNSLFFNIKQDPTKNGKILRYISDCENKNFIIHAQKVCKNLQELQKKQKQSKIYYVLSKRIVNDNQIILQMKQSSNMQNSSWIKLSKFVQEFKSIQILQLRINHNFTSLPIIKEINNSINNQSTTTVVELEFLRQSFGSITLSTENSQVAPLLKTYLYKQQKSNVLKLVGQAKQKNKSTLFFDCYFSESKYYLFIECNISTRISYLGENQPLLRVVEQINGQGLKNDYTQYLPVKNISLNNTKYNKQNYQGSLYGKMPRTINKTKFGQTGMSFKSQDDKISRLRQNFVEYLLKGKDS